MEKQKQPRGLRNCNPGNLRITKDKWKGLRANQTDRSFFQFEEMKWGYRALLRTLKNYRIRRGCITISDFIHRWAPPVENHTGNYIRRVCQDLQVPENFVIDIEDRESMCAFAAAISMVENGVPAVMDDIYAGWDLL